MSVSEPKLVYCATPSRMHRDGGGSRIREFVRGSGWIPWYLHDKLPDGCSTEDPADHDRVIEISRRAIEAADEFWVFGLAEEVLAPFEHALQRGKPIHLLHLKFDDDWRSYREEFLIPALRLLDAINLPVYAELRDEIDFHFLF